MFIRRIQGQALEGRMTQDCLEASGSDTECDTGETFCAVRKQMRARFHAVNTESRRGLLVTLGEQANLFEKNRPAVPGRSSLAGWRPDKAQLLLQRMRLAGYFSISIAE